MEMYEVNSSWINAVGADPKQGIIIGQFKSGTYQYSGIPSHIFTELLAAESKGQYFNKHILSADYAFEKLS